MLMRQIVDSLAQYERDIIRARTTAALAGKKTRGERVGGIPFGSQLCADGRTPAPHADEQRALGILRELRAVGYTLRAVDGARAVAACCAQFCAHPRYDTLGNGGSRRGPKHVFFWANLTQ